MKKFELEHPVSLDDGSVILAVVLRAPDLEDVEATNPGWLRLKPGQDAGDTFDVGMDLLARLSDLPRAVLYEMDAIDYVALCDLVAEQLFKVREQHEQETNQNR